MPASMNIITPYDSEYLRSESVKIKLKTSKNVSSDYYRIDVDGSLQGNYVSTEIDITLSAGSKYVIKATLMSANHNPYSGVHDSVNVAVLKTTEKKPKIRAHVEELSAKVKSSDLVEEYRDWRKEGLEDAITDLRTQNSTEYNKVNSSTTTIATVAEAEANTGFRLNNKKTIINYIKNNPTEGKRYLRFLLPKGVWNSFTDQSSVFTALDSFCPELYPFWKVNTTYLVFNEANVSEDLNDDMEALVTMEIGRKNLDALKDRNDITNSTYNTKKSRLDVTTSDLKEKIKQL